MKLDDKRVMHSMSIDDAYVVEQVLAQTKSGVTELVTLDGTGPFVRKRVFLKFAHRSVWAALADCNSPRLPHVEASYETPDTFVVVCSYIPGQTLTEYLAGRESIPSEEAVRIIENVCEAVAELHRHGVIHCDIMPENIIVAADGAHVIDLGIACMEHEGASSESAKLGTWGFAAPEQYGFANVDKRTDIYSLGRLFAYLLTGVRPDSDNFESAIVRLEQTEPQLYGVVKRASRFEPSGRYQSVAALVEDIRYACSPEAAKEKAGQNGASAGIPRNPQERAPEGSATEASQDSYWQSTPDPNQRKQTSTGKKIALAAAVCACCAAIGLGAVSLDSLKPSEGEQAAEEATASQDGKTNGESSANAEESTEADKEQAVIAEESAPFSILESGWHIDQSGYIRYSLAVHNDSDTTAARCPTILITGKDENGAILFSDSKTLCLISPGATVFYSGLTGEGVPPATIEFTTDDSIPVPWTSNASTEDCYSVSNCTALAKDNGSHSFTGEVRFNPELKDELIQQSCADDVCVSVVLRNESGEIIGGASNFVSAPPEGQSRAFQVDIRKTPEFDSYEIYANCC